VEGEMTYGDDAPSCGLLLKTLRLGSSLPVQDQDVEMSCERMMLMLTSSWQWQMTVVWTAALHRTCWTTVSRPPTLTLCDICVPSAVSSMSLPAQRLRSPGHSSCWPQSLELFPGFYPGPNHQYRLFQMSA